MTTRNLKQPHNPPKPKRESHSWLSLFFIESQAMLKTIDMSEQIEAIKKKFGRDFYRDPKAMQEAAQVWGVEYNSGGAPIKLKRETLVEFGHCKGEMSYVETTKGYVLLGMNASTSIGGFGYAPSIWDGVGFASYWDARACAVEKLINYFEKETASTNSCSSLANKHSAMRVVQFLREEMTPQLELF